MYSNIQKCQKKQATPHMQSLSDVQPHDKPASDFQ